jgi:hypothetical protein
VEEETVGTVIDEHAVPASIRLSDISSKFKFSEKDSRLKILDDLAEEVIFHSKMIIERLGVSEAATFMLASVAIILGAWDLGIGEFANGGDFNRVFTEGMLFLKDMSLIFALLSIIAWIGVVFRLWWRFPIMRENLVYLLVGMFAAQLGYISAHANTPNFPTNTGFNDWASVGMANLVLIFLSFVVVHRAVIETRDIHVEERHSHPDPRVVERARRDHSLALWSIGFTFWFLLVNLFSWAGAHAMASRPPIVENNFVVTCIYVLTNILAIGIFIHILWYPQFMLGGAGERIQSVRAREVSEDYTRAAPKKRQGICPICSSDTPVIQHPSGLIEVPCSQLDCNGRGKPGTTCVDCDMTFPTRIACSSCSSNTTITSHFTRQDAW